MNQTTCGWKYWISHQIECRFLQDQDGPWRREATDYHFRTPNPPRDLLAKNAVRELTHRPNTVRNADRPVRGECPRSRDAEAETRKDVSVHSVTTIRLPPRGSHRDEFRTLCWHDVDLDVRELELAVRAPDGGADSATTHSVLSPSIPCRGDRAANTTLAKQQMRRSGKLYLTPLARDSEDIDREQVSQCVMECLY